MVNEQQDVCLVLVFLLATSLHIVQFSFIFWSFSFCFARFELCCYNSQSVKKIILGANKKAEANNENEAHAMIKKSLKKPTKNQQKAEINESNLSDMLNH